MMSVSMMHVRMMHVHMIAVAIAIAFLLRILSLSVLPARQHWQRRWARALSAFVVPPLFLLMTAIAVVVMGPGSCHAWEGWLSYGLAISFVGLTCVLWLHLSWLAFVSQRAIRQHPVQTLSTAFGPVASHIINIPLAFSAQVGCWTPVLAVSEGLVASLDAAQLEAVLAHEQGHAHYQDTFWFFWLGGLRRVTWWLPATESLWQELLLLRELRADRWAAERVDPLVLAEALMNVVATPLTYSDAVSASFSCPATPGRLAERIDALLIEDSVTEANDYAVGHWVSMAWTLTPLLTIPWHHS